MDFHVLYTPSTDNSQLPRFGYATVLDQIIKPDSCIIHSISVLGFGYFYDKLKFNLFIRKSIFNSAIAGWRTANTWQFLSPICTRFLEIELPMLSACQRQYRLTF